MQLDPRVWGIRPGAPQTATAGVPPAGVPSAGVPSAGVPAVTVDHSQQR
jgi:hypothetical protein